MKKDEIRAIANGLSTQRLAEIRDKYQTFKTDKNKIILQEVAEVLRKRYIYLTKQDKKEKEVELRIPLRGRANYDDLKKVVEQYEGYKMVVLVLEHTDLVVMYRLGFRNGSFGDSVEKLRDKGWVKLIKG